jgi:hypothetical protein
MIGGQHVGAATQDQRRTVADPVEELIKPKRESVAADHAPISSVRSGRGSLDRGP